jgi:hypothetical protein
LKIIYLLLDRFWLKFNRLDSFEGNHARSLFHSFQTRSGNQSSSRSGFWVLTRLIFFLNQNNIVLVKIKKSTSCNRVLLGQLGHAGLFFLYFFNPVRLQSWNDLLHRVSKVCYVLFQILRKKCNACLWGIYCPHKL